MKDFYDLNIDENFNLKEIENIKQYKSIAINKTTSIITHIPEIYQKKFYKSQYSRITIKYSSQLSNSIIKKCQKYDIIAIKIVEGSELKSATEMQPDLISFDLSTNLKLKHGFVRDAISKGIFFEITTDICLIPENRMNWLANVKMIMEITNGRNIIICSAAKEFTELKSAKDILEMLFSFVSKKRAERIVYQNPISLLEKCALKRHSYRDLVVNDVENGSLKSDFLLKNHL